LCHRTTFMYMYTLQMLHAMLVLPHSSSHLITLQARFVNWRRHMQSSLHVKTNSISRLVQTLYNFARLITTCHKSVKTNILHDKQCKLTIVTIKCNRKS